MITFLPCIVSVTWVAMCFVSARREYRVKYAEARRKPAPQVYGGVTPHETAHGIAAHDAAVMFAFWFFLLAARLIIRGITGPAPRESAADASARIERELTEEFGARCVHGEITSRCAVCTAPDVIEQKPCPCGYVTECHIHCGDGSCHKADTTVGNTSVSHYRGTSGIVQRPQVTDPWLWEDKTMCSTCMAVMAFNLCLKNETPVPSVMGDLVINPCKCGQNKILSLGKIWTSQEK